MSDLKPTGAKIKLGKQEYGMRFTINAIDDIQDKFNTPIVDIKKIMMDERNGIKNLRYLLTLLINEDIDCVNDENKEQGKEEIKHVDEKYVGRHIDTTNINEMMTTVFKVFATGTPEVTDDSPNLKSE